jgi:hypothetical protein
MRVGDNVTVTVGGDEVGPACIVEASDDIVYVVVERPRAGPYRFGASRTFFEFAGQGRWHIDMPSRTRREFIPPA